MWASTAVPTALLEESPALWPELGDRAGTAAARGSLGLLTTPQDGYARAMVLCEEALAGDRDLEDRHGAGQPRACPLPLTLLDLGQRCARSCPRSRRRPSPTHGRRPGWSWVAVVLASLAWRARPDRDLAAGGASVPASSRRRTRTTTSGSRRQAYQ
jgi:hypothetical protein